MTNPTSNFGWQMPTSTDLVTDLPADFEVFGQAVDTDFVDLLGGASGYILSKASATDLDFAWIPNDQGDITAVNVTSPITGGGTSGAVTIGINAATTSVVGAVQLSDSTSTTSSVLASTPTATKAAYDLANTANTTANAAIAKSTVTTAGDIIYRNATVPVRLGIGTAGQILAVNSGATAPEWVAAPVSGGMTLLSTTTLSGASTTINITPTGYNSLYIISSGVVCSGNADFFAQLNAVTSSDYLNHSIGNRAGIAQVLTGNNNGCYFSFQGVDGYGTSSENTMELQIPDPNGSKKKIMSFYSTCVTATSSVIQYGMSNANVTAAISSIKFALGSAQTFSAGTVKVYGVK
jgi:hypothetical protein